jgi:para-nitrobenzyl esterase
MNAKEIARREFVRRIAAAAGAGFLTPGLLHGWARVGQSTTAPPAATVEAKTTCGKIRGVKRDSGAIVFKGIPYAGSPAGANRFKPPVPMKPWSGVRDALVYGPQSVQPHDPNMPKESVPTLTGEDCLVLNVWTRGADNRRRPVMFYSHGGGFTTGNGGTETAPGNVFHDGAALAESYDVVVVTHNHRLGLLGSMYLGEILGDDYAASGCAGMLDICAALRWVRENIENFGGDPANVMIFGESGGGFKTSLLTAMPDAHGNFHKASVESGSLLKGMPKAQGTQMARAVLAKLGLTDATAKKLHDLPTEDLLAAQNDPKISAGLGFSPVVDGRYIPSDPYDPAAPAISKDIPMIVGTNKDEAVFFNMRNAAVFSMDEAALKQRVTAMFGAKADRVIEVYRGSRPGASPTDLYLAIQTAQIFWANAVKMAERKAAQHAAPVFMYMFTYESNALANENPPYPFKASHAMEIAFKFDHPDSQGLIGTNPERFQVAKNMSHAWAQFARTGNPSFAGIPTWPAYTLERRETMLINAECKVVNDPLRAERELWRELPS